MRKLAASLAVGALVAAGGVAGTPVARAATPVDAFCSDNAAYLETTSHESGLDPAAWASSPHNLYKFGLQGPGDINALYHMVIDSPRVRSFWSNEGDKVEWRCS